MQDIELQPSHPPFVGKTLLIIGALELLFGIVLMLGGIIAMYVNAYQNGTGYIGLNGLI
ncbi:MAG: hypothetical protein ACJAZO_000840 [Myxococcota bacterium]|jgi:hypothetical protein